MLSPATGGLLAGGGATAPGPPGFRGASDPDLPASSIPRNASSVERAAAAAVSEADAAAQREERVGGTSEAAASEAAGGHSSPAGLVFSREGYARPATVWSVDATPGSEQCLSPTLSQVRWARCACLLRLSHSA